MQSGCKNPRNLSCEAMQHWPTFGSRVGLSPNLCYFGRNGRRIIETPLFVPMTSVYEKSGLRFAYPENWTVDDSESQGERAAVTVQSGSGAFWTVVRQPVAADPDVAAAEALKAMQEEYDELDAEPVETALDGFQLHGYDVNFICLDFTSTALIRATNTQAGTVVIFCQADDREFADVANVFAAMTMNVLQNLAG